MTSSRRGPKSETHWTQLEPTLPPGSAAYDLKSPQNNGNPACTWAHQKDKDRRLQCGGHRCVHRLSKGSRINRLGMRPHTHRWSGWHSTLSSTKVQQQPSIAFDQKTHPVVKTSNHELFVVGHDQPNMCPAQDWASQLEIQSFSEAQLTCHASKEADPSTDHACTSPIHRNAPMEHK